MNKAQLIAELNISMAEFNKEVNLNFKTDSAAPATQGDIVQLAQLVLDVFSDLKKSMEKSL